MSREIVFSSEDVALLKIPKDNAKNTLSFLQSIVLGFIAVFLAAGVITIADLSRLLVWPIGAMTAFYVVALLFKAYVGGQSVYYGLVNPSSQEVGAIKDEELPVYTILVPLFREKRVVRNLTKSLLDLDYPEKKLDIKLLLEGDDYETIKAARFLNLPDCFELVVVPPSYPRTKPKALNLGLAIAKGKYLVVFDAEDRPEPDQLKRAVCAFRKVEEDVVCLQARLDVFNPDTNVITKFFAAEYATFYSLVLPGLGKLGMPVPLGGTSNHFVTSTLRNMRGWDPFNVTEDLDLGMRIARMGLKVKMLESTTWEEANTKLGSWFKQRSRWLKGYIQTYLVHMRNPLALLTELGVINFLSFQITVGGTPLTMLVNPFFWAMTVIYILTGTGVIESFFPGPVFYSGLVAMVVGNFAFTYYTLTGAMLREQYGNVKWMLFSLFYWVLMSVGAWKGFLQLFVRPHYWEKTEHGLVKEEVSYAEDGKGVSPSYTPSSGGEPGISGSYGFEASHLTGGDDNPHPRKHRERNASGNKGGKG